MRTLLGSLVNRLVGNKPGVASASLVSPICVRPTRDVALVGIGDSNCQPVNLSFPLWSEVKNILVTVVHKALGVDWFEMSMRRDASFPFDRNSLYPVYRVLKLEESPNPHCDRKREKRILRGVADVQKERAISRQNSCNLSAPFLAPIQIFFVGFGIAIGAVINAEVVGRGRNHHVHRVSVKVLHSANAITDFQQKWSGGGGGSHHAETIEPAKTYGV